VCTGLVEVLWKRDLSYAVLLNAVLLAKCIHAHVWDNSHYVSKQLTGIGLFFSPPSSSGRPSGVVSKWLNGGTVLQWSVGGVLISHTLAFEVDRPLSL